MYPWFSAHKSVVSLRLNRFYSISPVVCSFLLILSLASSSLAAVTFVYPPQKGFVDKADHLILKLNRPDVATVRITVNGLASDMMEVGSPEYRKAFSDILIVQPVWDAGKNEILVELFKGAERVEAATGSVFFSTKAKTPIPEGYKPAVAHVAETEKLCVDCHNMNPNEAQATSLVEKENSCYGCHKRMLNVKYVHGPTGTYTCGYCHSLKGAKKYSTPRRDIELCNECHAEKAEDFKRRKFLHGPIDSGLCEICHDSHGTNFPAQLRMPINDMCLSCHEDVRKIPHVVRTTSGGGHPVGGKPDPSPNGKGRPMSCVSCHDPHAADVRYFFVNGAEDRMLLCQMCHNK